MKPDGIASGAADVGAAAAEANPDSKAKDSGVRLGRLATGWLRAGRRV